MTSGRLADAISHTKRAYESIEQRIAELSEAASKATSSPNSKGKGKASALDDDDISSLTVAQIQSELKDLKEVQTDLLMKVRFETWQHKYKELTNVLNLRLTS